MAENGGLSRKNCDRIAVICAELATNLIKHTKSGGSLLAQIIQDGERIALDLYCRDEGKGMDVKACIVDGFSSEGTLGTGLGAIKRMADECEMFSANQIGTVIHVRIWNAAANALSQLAWGGLSVPKKGQLVSGDKWSMNFQNSEVYCLLVDGLGHGIEASDASRLAVKRFKSNFDLPPAPMLKLLHASLRGSRGAVGAVAKLDLKTKILTFCGLGNIDAIVQTGAERKHLVSLNGTLGYEARKFNEYSVPWTKDSTLVMHSDGFSSKTMQDIEGMETLSAGLMAGLLYQKHAKTSDDATVCVLKHTRSK